MTRELAGILRLEGLAVLVLAVAAYASLGASWFLFSLLLLVPDVSMTGMGGTDGSPGGSASVPPSSTEDPSRTQRSRGRARSEPQSQERS